MNNIIIKILLIFIGVLVLRTIIFLLLDNIIFVENMVDVTTINNEAIQNIASIYNKDNLTVTSLAVTDKVKGNLNIEGTLKSSSDLTTDGAIKSKVSVEAPIINATSGAIKLGDKVMSSESDGWTRYKKSDGKYANLAFQDLWVAGDLTLEGKLTIPNGSAQLNTTLSEKEMGLWDGWAGDILCPPGWYVSGGHVTGDKKFKFLCSKFPFL